MSFFQKNIYPLTLFVLTLSVYIFFAGRLKFEFPTGPYNYFSHQTHSFLHAKLSLFSTELTHDLSIFNGKKYMYWGPTPILFTAPFIAIFGLNFSDALYTAIISSFAPLILFLILKQANKNKDFFSTDLNNFLISLFFAFGTPLFILSVYGQVWFTSQAISTLFVLLALLFLFKFKNLPKNSHLLISSAFLALAIWGRSSLALYFPLFIFQIYLALPKKNHFSKIFFKKLALFSLPLFITLLTYFFYNYLRFNNILETGYSYHNMHPHFAADKEKYGVINPNYFSRNFHYMFANFPKATSHFPYFVFDQEGNSVLFTSPLLILLLLTLKKYFTNYKKNLSQISILLTSLAITFLLLLFFGTGWVQFGYRYLMDAFPLFAILLADAIKKVPTPITLGLFAFSVFANILGILWFFNL